MSVNVLTGKKLELVGFTKKCIQMSLSWNTEGVVSFLGTQWKNWEKN